MLPPTELLAAAEDAARKALAAVATRPREDAGWSLLAGHAGVYAVGALCLDAAAREAKAHGRGERAEALRAEVEACLQARAAALPPGAGGGVGRPPWGRALPKARQGRCSSRGERPGTQTPGHRPSIALLAGLPGAGVPGCQPRLPGGRVPLRARRLPGGRAPAEPRAGPGGGALPADAGGGGQDPGIRWSGVGEGAAGGPLAPWLTLQAQTAGD